MAEAITVNLTVNGTVYQRQVEPRLHLVDFLRDILDIKTARVSCEHGVCGACTVRVDGDIVRGCLMLAVQAANAEVETIDWVSDNGELADLQEAFHRRNAAQCGFCTPGMLLTAQALLHERPQASREQVREYISGNYCRCTGYHAIVDAIGDVQKERLDKSSAS